MTRRLTAFITVGAIGFLLQIGTLALLTVAVGWPHVPATAIAVELAALHNFCWHERWTWSNRTAGRHEALRRLAKYHLTTGMLSVCGNLVFTAMWADVLGLGVIAANIAAVATMTLATFTVADRWVFAPSR